MKYDVIYNFKASNHQFPLQFYLERYWIVNTDVNLSLPSYAYWNPKDEELTLELLLIIIELH